MGMSPPGLSLDAHHHSTPETCGKVASDKEAVVNAASSPRQCLGSRHDLSEDSTTFPFALDEDDPESTDDMLALARLSSHEFAGDGVSPGKSLSSSASDAAVGALVQMLQGASAKSITSVGVSQGLPSNDEEGLTAPNAPTTFQEAFNRIAEIENLLQAAS